MASETTEGGWGETFLGFAIIFLVLGGIFLAGRAIYTHYYKPAPVVVSLSAYFVDDAGTAVTQHSPNYRKSHIKIRGDVYQGGQTVKSGNVRITITTEDDLFQQSISVPLQNGHFESDDPAFASLRPGTAIVITAEIAAPGADAVSSIHLNSQPPADKSAFEYGVGFAVILMAVVFFVAFTGNKTPWKNQTAIIFSYLVIAIFLAVPILAPVILVQTFPSAVEDMIGAPAGLINVHTPNQPDGERQWALNIGGYSFKTWPRNYNAAKTTDDTTATPAPAATTDSQPTTATAPTTGGAVPSATTSTETAAPTQNTTSTPDSGDTAAATTPAATTTTGSTAIMGQPGGPMVQVQGGLVIPLYVIILSVIGGAINMTRKVPGLQKEGEGSESSFARPLSRLGMAVMNVARPSGAAGTGAARPADQPVTPPDPSGTATTGVKATTVAAKETAAPAPSVEVEGEGTELSLEAQAEAIEAQLEPLVIQQIRRNCDSDDTLAEIRSLVLRMKELYKSSKSDERLLKFSSFEDWAASHPRLGEMLRGSWRVELLNQYMYLISAPFLAVVTYYILDLLGLSKQGVVVVLSFSVGLVSEKIVSWILGIASGYLRPEAGSATTGKA